MRPDQQPTVALRDRDLLRIPDALPLYAVFLASLRCGFDPAMHPNPKVAKSDEDGSRRPERSQTQGSSSGGKEDRERVWGNRDKFERNMQRLRSRIVQRSTIASVLGQTIDRLADTGQQLGIAPAGEPGVRQSRTSITDDISDARLRGPLNVGPAVDFNELKREVTLPINPAAQRSLVASVRKHVRRLRSYFERLGLQTMQEYGRPPGATFGPRRRSRRDPQIQSQYARSRLGKSLRLRHISAC